MSRHVPQVRQVTAVGPLHPEYVAGVERHPGLPQRVTGGGHMVEAGKAPGELIQG
jgi:hypothetical protein